MCSTYPTKRFLSRSIVNIVQTFIWVWRVLNNFAMWALWICGLPAVATSCYDHILILKCFIPSKLKHRFARFEFGSICWPIGGGDEKCKWGRHDLAVSFSQKVEPSTCVTESAWLLTHLFNRTKFPNICIGLFPLTNHSIMLQQFSISMITSLWKIFVGQSWGPCDYAEVWNNEVRLCIQVKGETYVQIPSRGLGRATWKSAYRIVNQTWR